MRKKIITPVIIAFLFITSLCAAQSRKGDAIDIAYKKCVAKDTTCPNVGTCAFLAYAKWEKEMNACYDKLLPELKKEDEKKALKAAQTAWITYRDATFASYDMMFDIPGDKWCRLRHENRIEIVRTRTLQLRNYFESLKKKAPIPDK